nr:Mur ligase domain-containing protein [Bacteroidales bacterium]
MNLENVNNVYFLGIGGIGMSALARWFHHLGISVSGYDKTPSQLTKELESEGINICYDDAPEFISSKPDLVVITPAIPTTHQGRIWLEEQGIPFMKR